MVSTAGLVLVLAVVTQVLGVIQDCLEVPSETNFKMEDVEGNWYPMEIVLHRNDSKIYGIPTETNCPTVTFGVGPKSKKTLTMYWNSTAGDLEYKFTQKGSKGQWQSSAEQTGKAAILTVEKDKYMIIRNCSNNLHNTIILSKHSSMSQDVMNEANNEIAKLLKYPPVEKKSLCANDASVSKTLPASVVLASISILMLLLRQ
uniref:Lipocalin/cytosolic fatty-acid binding domain-containing protein n=1 Tax=Cuerna arida TaxID=1464854 RepID=A0A1B6FEP8_9HEMI